MKRILAVVSALAVLILTTTADAVEPSADGLVLYYSFDTDGGSVVADESGLANDGTVDGPVWTASGKVGGAYLFDGVNDYILTGDELTFPAGTDDFTVSAWVKPYEFAGQHRIILCNDDGPIPTEVSYCPQFLFCVGNDGSTSPLEAYVGGSDDPPNQALRTEGMPWTYGQWYHLAFTRTNGTVSIYRDGVLLASRLDADSILRNPLIIGYRIEDGMHPWDGLIDEVRVYRRALSQSEILTQAQGTTQFYLDTGAGAGGSVDIEDGLQAASSVVTITATASSGYRFVQWTGDVPAGHETDNPLDVTMDRARTVTAGFGVDGVCAEEGLVLYYSFDDDNGSVALDRSGFGNDGLVNGPAWTASGRFGGAYQFDGTNDFVRSCDSTNYPSGQDDFTISVWVRPDRLADDHRVIVRSQEPNQFQLYLDLQASTNSCIETLLGGGGGSWPVETPRLPWTLGAWYHVVATRENGTVRLYRDGVQQGTGTDADNIVRSALDIGFGTYDGLHPWDGAIDEVRVYRRALSQSEILTQAQATGLFYLDTGAGAGGSVDIEDGWQAANSVVTITATASSGYHFVQWTGDVPAGQSTTNPLAVTMDQARTISAAFEVDAVSTVFSYGGHDYEFFTDHLTWAEANTRAQASGGYLAIINDTNENLFVFNHIPAGRKVLWLGGQDRTQEGTWRWVDGTLLTNGYQNWGFNNPDNGAPGEGQDFLVMRGDDALNYPDGKWDDFNDEVTEAAYPRGYVVEYDGVDAGDPVLYLSFDVDNGTVAIDDSGTGNDGIVSNAVWQAQGAKGGCYRFAGTNSCVSVAPSTTMNLDGQSYSVSYWVNAISIENSPQFIGKAVPPIPRSMDDEWVQIGLYADGRTLWGAQGDGLFVSRAPTFWLGNWHHVAGTFDAATRQQTMYIDGVLVGSRTANGPLHNTDGGFFCVGNNSLESERGLSGMLDEVYLYKKVLSSNEVQTLYDAGVVTQHYYLDTAAGAGGSVNVGDGAYEEGAVVTITATPLGGYAFAGWTGDVPSGEEMSSPLTVTMDQARTITATFEVNVVIDFDQPVLYLSFDQDNGTVAMDGSGYGNHGTVSNASWQAQGAEGAACGFVGTNSCVAVPPSASMNLDGQSVSVACWVNAESLANHPTIIGKGVPPLPREIDNEMIMFGMYSDGRMYWGWHGDALQVGRSPSFWVGNWHHLVGTFDAGTRIQNLYIDGVLVGSRTAHGPLHNTDNGFFCVGNDTLEPARGLSGMIDEVYLYRKVLSPDEVENLYGSSNAPPNAVLTANPVSGIAPLDVTLDFSASSDSDGTITLCEVDREGDGIYETQSSQPGQVKVTYGMAGAYIATVRVTDNGGLKDTASVPVTVAALASAPTAVAEVVPVIGTAPLTVVLDGSGSSATAGRQLILYEWDADGDGVYDVVGQTPQVYWQYGQPGTYAPTLRVTDDAGMKDSDSQAVTVTDGADAPTVILSVSPSGGDKPLNVLLEAVVNDDGPVNTFLWDFEGDGEYDRLTATSSVSYIYQSVGSFHPKVMIVDADELVATDSETVTVAEPSAFKVWITMPKPGQCIWGDAVSIKAHAAPGSMAKSVQLQYKLSSSGTWINLGDVIEPQPHSYSTTWDVTGLVDGSEYDVRAVGTDINDGTVSSETVTVIVDSSSGNKNEDVVEGDENGKHVKDQKVDKDQTTTVEVYDGTSVTVPMDAIDEDLTLEVELTDDFGHKANGAANDKAGIGADREVTIEGDPDLGKMLEITIPYEDADNDGIVDNTGVSEDSLSGYWYDDADGKWKKAQETELDTEGNCLKIKTPHLSKFGSFGDVVKMWPAGNMTVDDRNPELWWPAKKGSTWYHVWINKDGKKHKDVWINQTDTSWVPPSDLPSGSYTWYVQGWNKQQGNGPWSAGSTFKVTGSVPAKPAALAPVGTVDQFRPQFSWTASEGSEWYYIWINLNGQTLRKEWINSGTAWTPPADLPAGRYQWWVRGWNADGFSPWSATATFTRPTLIPGAVTLLEPAGALATSSPEFRWNAAQNATWYYLYVSKGNNKYLAEWMQDTSYQSSRAMPVGSYKWWIRGWSPDGYGPWSTGFNFTIE